MEPEPGLDLNATIWNAFIGLLAMSEAEELSAAQRPAQLAFWYESEVQNGGHLQYFLNRGPAEAESAIAALERIGASIHSRVLRAAFETWQAVSRNRPASIEEYSQAATEGEFDTYDQQFYAAPALMGILESFLNGNRDLFVVVD
jgi:hypothetical protein